MYEILSVAKLIQSCGFWDTPPQHYWNRLKDFCLYVKYTFKDIKWEQMANLTDETVISSLYARAPVWQKRAWRVFGKIKPTYWMYYSVHILMGRPCSINPPFLLVCGSDIVPTEEQGHGKISWFSQHYCWQAWGNIWNIIASLSYPLDIAWMSGQKRQQDATKQY